MTASRRDKIFSRGFTMIEVVAVIVIMGMLAGATAWSMMRDASRARSNDITERIAAMDKAARLAATCGRERVSLVLDFDEQKLVTRRRGADGNIENSHSLKMPAGCELKTIARCSYADGASANESISRSSYGVVEVDYSSAGRCNTYAVELGFDGSSDKQGHWLVFSGLTGQMSVINKDEQLREIFSMLLRGGTDAD